MTATYMVVPSPVRWWCFDVIVDHPSGRRTRADQVSADTLAALEASLEEQGYVYVTP